jgi:murein DD-endopeptidase MepM/ murein hydrolase activator NlpD
MSEPTSNPLPSRRELRHHQQESNIPETGSVQSPLTVSLQLQPTKRAERLTHKPLGQRVLSIATLIAAPLLFVGVSLPANIFYTNNQPTPAIANEAESFDAAADAGQAFVASGSKASVEGIQRESWSVTSYAEVLRARYGGRTLSYSTTGQGPVRWPFPVAVPISSGFGARVAPCRYCSSYHRGVDFTPGRGTPIYAISDGVVTQQEYSGGYGEHAYIEHTINGQTVLSVYAHMIGGSSPLEPGDRVQVGDFVGLVGNTGISTGPHLHFEIRIDGVYLDPFTWLQENAQ